MEGWHAKRCANKVGIYKSEGKYIKPIPATFSYYSKKCRDRALYIYFTFIFLFVLLDLRLRIFNQNPKT